MSAWPDDFAPSCRLRAVEADTQRHPRADENREKAATRWAQTLLRLGAQPPDVDDDAAWRRLASKMGERQGYVPSADTREMIHERRA